MRILVKCATCARQYDGTGHPGKRFRCHCGAMVTVEEARGHEASVVRCSSCGAPRSEGGTVCKHCSADYTLHERDLDTVCPSCLARVSNRAKFCHHCGTRMMAELAVKSESDVDCPVCGSDQHLTHRAVAPEINVLECGKCAGMWVGNATFELLSKRAEQSAAPVAIVDPQKPAPQTPSALEQPGPAYRRCCECTQLMQRKNFGRVSGVILDQCKAHGIWFDANELDAILRWLGEGGGDKARLAEMRAQQQLNAPPAKSAPVTTSPVVSGGAALVVGASYARDPLMDLLRAAMRFLR